MLFSFGGVDFSYGDNLILSSVSFAVHEGERVGLVGENGAGKTTLIKLLCGGLVPDSGEIIKKNAIKVGYLEQNGGYESGNTVFEELRLVFKEELEAVEKLSSLSERLAECEYGGAEYRELSQKIEALNKFVASHDSYNVDVKIKTVLGGMGLDKFSDRVIDSMSGGEKTKLKLTRLLLEQPDLLVLDEPTNHLDVKTLFWLENYLQSYKGAVLVVSHDRYFLDAVTMRILEIENKRLYSYAGNYTKYKLLKAERIEREQKLYERQQEEIKKLQTFVDKNIVRATTAKSAQSRVKQLERMEVLPKPYLPPRPPRFDFSYLERPAEVVINIDGLNLEMGDKRLICGGQLKITRGMKVAVVGDNGVGKSTLLRAIVGGNPAVVRGRFVKLAYYDQEMANLNPSNTVLAELWERHVAYSQTQVRASLARCGLFPEDMDKKISSLSGGERAKLALCVFENEGGNVLILDEPTNHLDLPARESLESALSAFDGTVIVVSHDRYFLSAVADTVAEIENCALKVYEGGYAGYKKSKEQEAQQLSEKLKEEESERYKIAQREGHRSRTERAAEARLKAEIKSIEADISRCECEEEQINARLADPAVAADYKEVLSLTARLEEIKKQLDGLYERYGQIIG